MELVYGLLLTTNLFFGININYAILESLCCTVTECVLASVYYVLSRNNGLMLKDLITFERANVHTMKWMFAYN